MSHSSKPPSNSTVSGSDPSPTGGSRSIGGPISRRAGTSVFIRYMISTLTGLSPAFVLSLVAIALVPLLSGDFYLMELLVLALIYSLMAASWDVLSGYTEQPNFGHALFVGGAGYIAALLNIHLALPPYLSVPASAVVSGVVGLGIGGLTLRLRGPYFALSTIVFSAVLFKLAYIFWWITGGEEGLTGIEPFTNTVEGDLYITLLVFAFSFLTLSAFARSHFGLVLRSTRHNEEAAEASGVNTAFYKIVGFAVSGFFAGIAGAVYVHTHMQIGPGMLAGSLSVLIVLLATIGGGGTLVGPALAAGLLTLVDQSLRVSEEYRIVIFTGALILLIYLNPSGFANAPALSRVPKLRWFLLGRNHIR